MLACSAWKRSPPAKIGQIEDKLGCVTYMVHSKKFSLVLKNHNLIFRIACVCIFPIVYCYLSGFGAVFAWYVENATSRGKFAVTESLFTNSTLIINVGI